MRTSPGHRDRDSGLMIWGQLELKVEILVRLGDDDFKSEF